MPMCANIYEAGVVQSLKNRADFLCQATHQIFLGWMVIEILTGLLKKKKKKNGSLQSPWDLPLIPSTL